MINAGILAKDRGIKVTEIAHADDDADYHTMVRVTLKTERDSYTVAGTLLGGQQPRIVEVNNVKLEARFAPHLLYIQNEDRPGFIGALGQCLGVRGVNIANFHLGRKHDASGAIALVEVDGILPEGTLQHVLGISGVRRATCLAFSA
jgi:D-3-phosphoglycerate dehydrogenase